MPLERVDTWSAYHGRALKEIRRNAGWHSAQEFSAVIGYARGRIQQIEACQGRAARPSKALIEAIAEVLKRSPIGLYTSIGMRAKQLKREDGGRLGRETAALNGLRELESQSVEAKRLRELGAWLSEGRLLEMARSRQRGPAFERATV